ncbi:nucleocapsid [Blechomonas maslovi leishbunyavirus 1]|uniref:Nucleocapsid n=1 Tax=Blechomonas maslovi leishbunyavirus 1 TaxID=2364199 RepID=A0A386ISA8_9VIRU|nr:nucleocapsid [Blechomonas maslovi leishbunyavirus 1]
MELNLDYADILNGLEYDDQRPWITRQRIETSGDAQKAKVIAYMVGIRGTNLSKIETRSKDKSLASSMTSIARALASKYGVSVAHIASCYPEILYDARKDSKSPVSVNTLQFLKHAGLTKQRWIMANHDFNRMVGINNVQFDRVADMIWNDDSFKLVLGERLPE